MAAQVAVVPRRPLPIVGTVQDAVQLAGGRALLQDALQTGAELWRLDLAGVPGRHGRDRVGEHEAGFHERDASVELELEMVEGVRRYPQASHARAREHSLVREVVDGEDHPC